MAGQRMLTNLEFAMDTIAQVLQETKFNKAKTPSVLE
jgi:hypothetical protein